MDVSTVGWLNINQVNDILVAPSCNTLPISPFFGGMPKMKGIPKRSTSVSVASPDPKEHVALTNIYVCIYIYIYITYNILEPLCVGKAHKQV